MLIAVAFNMADSSAVPAALAAPYVAPAHVGYAQAIPQSIPPYSSQISVVNRAVSPLVAAPAPFAASIAPYGPAPYLAAAGFAPFWAGPGATPFVAGPGATPLVAGPGPLIGGPAPYALPAAAYAAPYPYGTYGAATPLLRTPFGYAPTFVR